MGSAQTEVACSPLPQPRARLFFLRWCRAVAFFMAAMFALFIVLLAWLRQPGWALATAVAGAATLWALWRLRPDHLCGLTEGGLVIRRGGRDVVVKASDIRYIARGSSVAWRIPMGVYVRLERGRVPGRAWFTCFPDGHDVLYRWARHNRVRIVNDRRTSPHA